MAIAGLASLQRKFRTFPRTAREDIATAMEKSAEEIAALARSLAPTDTGRLRASIGWTWGAAPKGTIALGTVESGRGAGNLRITVYAGSAAAFYAPFVEFGTRAARAHPFFFPAYRALKRRVKSRITRAVKASARRAAAGQGA